MSTHLITFLGWRPWTLCQSQQESSRLAHLRPKLRKGTKLRTVCKEVPGRVHALSNEVADLQVVLQQLTAVAEERRQLTSDDQLHIPSLVSQAEEKLKEIKKIVEALAKLCASNNKVFLRASQWRKFDPKLKSLKDDINAIKSSLNLLIGASNS